MLERLFVLRYLLGRSKQSVVRTMAIISVGGIALGVMAMVVVLSVMGGFDQAIKKRLLGVQPHLLVPAAKASDQTKIEGIVGDLGKVESYAQQDVIIRTLDGLFSGAFAQGMDAQSLWRLGQRVKHNVEVFDAATGQVVSGKNETSDINFNLGPKEVAIGIDLARSLGIFDGDEINVLAPENLLLPSGEVPVYEKVKVAALIRSNVPDIDSRGLFYNFKTGLNKLRDTASLESGLEVRFEDPMAAIAVGEELKTAGFKTVKTWQDLNSALFYSLKMERTFMGIFLGLTILVSSFSVIAVLVLLVIEKRSDVGVLRAMGATKKKVRRIFVSIGLTLGLVGILGGTIMGLIVCWVLATYPIFELPKIYYDTTIPVRVDKLVVFGVVCLGTLLAWIGTLIPAWRVSEFMPIDAIRKEDI